MLGTRAATTERRIRVAGSWAGIIMVQLLDMIDYGPDNWWRKSSCMFVVMWRLMWVAFGEHLLNVSQGGWRQGGRRQCRCPPVAVAAGVAVPHPWVAAIGAVGGKDVKAGFWSARGSQFHYRRLRNNGIG